MEFEDNKHFWSRSSELREWAKNAVKDASARNWRCGTLGVKKEFNDANFFHKMFIWKFANYYKLSTKIPVVHS